MSIILNLSALVVTVLASRMACLSLEDIHSSLRTFKSIPLNDYKDKTLGSALDTVRRRRQEYPLTRFYGSYSLPLQASEYYKRLEPFVKKQDEEVVDVPLGYNQIESNYLEEPSPNDLFSTALALKLSQIFEQNDENEPDVGLRVFKGINMKRKRSTSKHNKPNSALDKSNDLKIVKQHAEQLIKHRPVLSKTKTKRKSTRRVLNDHFNVEENKAANNVIDKNNKHSATGVNSQNNSSVSVVSSHSSTSKTSLSSQKIGDKNMKEAEAKKSITKRKVTIPPVTDKSSAHNESKIKSNEPKSTDKKVMSELNDILGEDKKEKLETKPIQIKKAKKVENNKQSPEEPKTKQKQTLIKKKNKRSNQNEDSVSDDIITDEIENELIIPNLEKTEDEKSVSNNNEWPVAKESLDEWLRKEYYKNIAKTLATMRKKRSQTIDLSTDDYSTDASDLINSVEDSIGENFIAIDDSSESIEDQTSNDDSKNSEKLDDDSDDDYVIATQDDDDSTDKDIDESLIWSDADEKNRNHKSKRSVSSYFGEIGDNVQTNEVSIDSERFAHVNNKLEVIEDALINEALDLIRETARKGSQTEAESQKIENRLDAAYDIEDMRSSLDNLHKAVIKINNENSNGDNDQELDNEIPVPIIPISQIDVEKKNDFDTSDRDCLALELLSSDCSSVSNMVPNGRVKDSFTEACNWHQVCYTCGQVYGLLSSDCDAGFLETSRLGCDDSPSCETFARLILGPLRQSRVFYKSNVPQTCYQYQCIRDFLFDTQDRKR